MAAQDFETAYTGPAFAVMQQDRFCLSGNYCHASRLRQHAYVSVEHGPHFRANPTRSRFQFNVEPDLAGLWILVGDTDADRCLSGPRSSARDYPDRVPFDGGRRSRNAGHPSDRNRHPWRQRCGSRSQV